MQRIVYPFMALVAVVAAGCGGGEAAPEPAAETRDLRPGVTVRVVQPTPFTHRFAVQGNVETDGNALVTAEFSGLVEDILVEEGAEVREGQALIRLNTDLLDRSEEELQTQLNLATDLFERQSRLWSEGIGSEVEFLQLKASKEALEKSLSTLTEQRDMAVVRAPFSGVLDRIFTKRGELAAPGVPMVRIIDLDGMYVRAMVSDHYAGSLSTGMPATVEVEGVGEVGTAIGRVGSFINPANRTIEITLPLPDGSAFLPNMFANVWLQDLALDSAVVLPSALVQQDVTGQDYVFVVGSEGTAEKRVVELGVGSGNEVLVERGLAWNEQVVEKGASRIVAGEQVRIIEQ